MDTSIDTARAEATGKLSRKVLDYSIAFRHLMMDRMKQPDFNEADWEPVASLVATGDFKRVGAFRETMDWASYRQFILQWGKAAQWDGTFRRITEVPGLVFLELEERTVTDGHHGVANTVTVYCFNADDKLVHLDVYLQREM
jgi:hypothetical protein